MPTDELIETVCFHGMYTGTCLEDLERIVMEAERRAAETARINAEFFARGQRDWVFMGSGE